MNIAEVKAGMEDMNNRIEALRKAAAEVPDGYLLYIDKPLPSGGRLKIYYQQRDGKHGFFLGIRDDWAGAPVFDLASADGNIAARPDLKICRQHVGDFILERLRDCVAGLAELKEWLAALEKE